jgi:hypothetical protein
MRHAAAIKVPATGADQCHFANVSNFDSLGNAYGDRSKILTSRQLANCPREFAGNLAPPGERHES